MKKQVFRFPKGNIKVYLINIFSTSFKFFHILSIQDERLRFTLDFNAIVDLPQGDNVWILICLGLLSGCFISTSCLQPFISLIEKGLLVILCAGWREFLPFAWTFLICQVCPHLVTGHMFIFWNTSFLRKKIIFVLIRIGNWQHLQSFIFIGNE